MNEKIQIPDSKGGDRLVKSWNVPAQLAVYFACILWSSKHLTDKDKLCQKMAW